MATPNQVPRLYKSVVDDVIANVREAFLDEGVDEQVLQELKQSWENKLQQSKALDPVLETQETGIQLPTTIQYTSQVMHQQQAPPRTQAQIPVPVHIATHQGGEISQPAAVAAMALPQGVFQQQLQALAAQGYTLLPTSNGQFIIQAAMPQQQQAAQAQIVTTIPQQATLVQQNRQVPTVVQNNQNTQGVLQFDGADDSSSEDDDDDDNDDDDDDENDENKDGEDEFQGEEEEPLNSEDDVSDEDPTDLFDTDNVVVCQYDKINRNKNKWKFYLKDGIMNLNGRDFVFQKANGDAEW
ncbi:transcription initiation factor IIA subunit 1-like [Mytilus galloprovincialis]|uniref:Transcription initiation factor TFIIA large subunit n=2 Tax=Mytilus TaxID=6548 RepID=A0A8B6E205_MYTGA|nr:GTF2A1 [Mytilus edulis]VDI27542.1 transcription initiation factor TFIIA large subunit [Mytilus galloprovincialis]